MPAQQAVLQVVVLPRSEANCIRVGENRYVLVHIKKGPPLLVNTRCPHRGGPLHLGCLDESGTSVVCPMHRLSIPAANLERRALPIVIRTNLVTAVLPNAVLPNDANPADAPTACAVLTTIGGPH